MKVLFLQVQMYTLYKTSITFNTEFFIQLTKSLYNENSCFLYYTIYTIRLV